MIERIITALLLVIAAIHLLPVVGVAGGDRLTALYAIDTSDRNLAILMRHRAVLFALLGSFLAVAAFRPALQPMAFIAAFVSVSTFLLFALTTGDYSPAIRKVVIADVIAGVCLAVAVALFVGKRAA
jgi:hypothetical protein